MRNVNVAHNFFYHEGRTFDRSSMTVSYRNNIYYSYNTAIGQITEDRQGRKVCIISNDGFSSTTRKHIGELRGASKYPTYYLPQNIGNREFYPREIVKELSENLKYYSESKLTQKPNREHFTETYLMLQSTLDLKMFKEYDKDIKKVLKQYETLYADINNPEKLKKIKEIQLERAKKEKAKLARKLKEYINKYDVAQLARIVCEDLSVDAETRRSIRQYLNPNNDLSFIWFSNDKVCTSQHISVDRREATALLHLWERGKLKHGMTISYYTVLEVKNDYIKVGCHKIPVSNLLALLEQEKKVA
jgi:hypothetical protein